MKKIIAMTMVVFMIALIVSGCSEADKVSSNLSLEADNFNVYRQLTVIDTRTDTVMFQMRGNFSIEKEADGDLAVIGEDENGQYYKHFVCLSRDVTYIVEQLIGTGVNKHKYEINFNPEMILPFEPVVVD